MQYKSKEYYEAQKEFENLSESEKEEIMKESKEIGDYLQKNLTLLLPIILSNGKPNISSLMALGSITDEFCKKFNKTPVEFIEYLRMFGDSIKNNLGMTTPSYGNHFKKKSKKYSRELSKPIDNDIQDSKEELKSNLPTAQLEILKELKEKL